MGRSAWDTHPYCVICRIREGLCYFIEITPVTFVSNGMNRPGLKKIKSKSGKKGLGNQPKENVFYPFFCSL